MDKYVEVEKKLEGLLGWVNVLSDERTDLLHAIQECAESLRQLVKIEEARDRINKSLLKA